ncbi:hypothetical protein [Streptomyces tubercidicus]|uniref:hypothetical protein n=1 Tax=Streptomyces tubercidicus TaxID=47759 RepID=UPI0022B7B78F|nr:hypothetical protein [Streptomyces tubercidicus]WAU10254.1 hypothetical protein STRTU_000325 [Streptomyces tubercidicus]
MTLPWREDESWRRRYPQAGPDWTQGMPQGRTDALTPMGRVEQYGQMGSALRGGWLAPWQRKVIFSCVVGAVVVAAVSVLLVAFG